MPKWCDATVTEKRVWTDGLFTLTMKAPDVVEFEPGQFLHLALGDEENRVNRPYSVASPHGDTIEFFIVRVDDGALTPRLWALEVGDTLQVSQKAAGRFSLKHTPEAKHLWLIGTGTGLAPYIAMLRSEQAWDVYEKIVVVHGVRYAADLAYTEELQALAESKTGRFSLIQALTREESEGTLKGRIPALLEDGSLEKAAGCTMQHDNSSVLLCGNPAMLDDMESKLGERDMKRHRSKAPGQIVLERYW